MHILFAVIGAALIAIILWDAFETIILPRRVTRRFRLTRLFYRCTWKAWSGVFHRLASGRRQEVFLSFFGPLSLIFLLGIWAAGLIFGFALLNWAIGLPVRAPEGAPGFGTYLYLSGTTFFTLGMGDVTPISPLARAVAVTESGLGFGFLALIISYLPPLSQSFSRREVNISLLDARAGSPSTAAEMLRRHSQCDGMEALRRLLGEWEIWSAELLESHLSFPVLAYFRSQHENQSWLSALTTILDTSAFIIAGTEGVCEHQARLTFAIARHAVVDLAFVFSCPPRSPEHDRLPPEELRYLHAALAGAGVRLHNEAATGRTLLELRRMYEPYVSSLSDYLCLSVPPWIPGPDQRDNWQTSAWELVSGIKPTGERHF